MDEFLIREIFLIEIIRYYVDNEWNENFINTRHSNILINSYSNNF